jgi:hypothetical protein
MLILLTKQVRGWATGILVVAYAFGILTPSLAFSFDNQASIIHSLTEIHGGILMPHIHHDNADGKHSDQRSPDGGHHCCGVLALAGLLPPADVSIADPICVSLISTVPQVLHSGCGPIRLDRPPRLTPLI